MGLEPRIREDNRSTPKCPEGYGCRVRVWRVLLYAREEQVTGSVWHFLESRDLVFVTPSDTPG